jgi:hypothetical protein
MMEAEFTMQVVRFDNKTPTNLLRLCFPKRVIGRTHLES